MIDMKERAKNVIVEIARQSSGDAIEGKVKLFKAFYFAHLYYAGDEVSYLTEWPIVRMPRGPGIDDFAMLIDELVDEGRIRVEHITVGPYPSVRFCATDPAQHPNAGAVKAISKAVRFVSNKTGGELSDITHEYCQSWATTPNGSELNIYSDLVRRDPAAEKRAENVSKAVNEVFG